MKTAKIGGLVIGLASAVIALGVLHAQESLPPRLRGPVLEGPNIAQLKRGQQDYVMRNCHFCHGPTLADARGGGADLGHSQLVANDRGGDMIGAVVRAGTPRTQTAMPRYPDMSDAELSDIAAYVHYMRQRIHDKEIGSAALPAGDAQAGKAFFLEHCAACHTGQHGLSAAIARYDDQALAQRIARPAPALPTAPADAPGREAHLRLLELEKPQDVGNVVAFLRASKGKVSADEIRLFAAHPPSVESRFALQCGMCHGKDGLGSLRGPALRGNPDVAALGPEGIQAFIAQGSAGGMPAFKLTQRDLDAYSAWILDTGARR